MKWKSNVLYVWLISLIVVISSCNNMTEESNLMYNEEMIESVNVKDGMFVFNDQEHLRKVSILYKQLSKSEKNKWNKENGIETYGNIFSEVIDAEDSISDYYMSLPIEEQAYYLTQPQVHSEIYKKSLNDGLIKVVSEDNNEYFDINLIDKEYADFVNTKGNLMIGDDIYEYNSCEKKIYVGVGKVGNINSDTEVLIIKSLDIENLLLKSDDWNSNNWSQKSSAKYYGTSWTGKRKVWAEIEGVSYLWEDPTLGRFCDCSDYLHCDFILKAYAQKKNFWGKYVFSGNFWPEVKFSGTWSYNCAHWVNDNNSSLPDQCLCGFNTNDKYRHIGEEFPEYSCTPNQSIMCRTSPLNYTTSGNGYELSVAPTGVFRYDFPYNSNYWWAEPIDVYGDITIKIDGESFNFSL